MRQIAAVGVLVMMLGCSPGDVTYVPDEEAALALAPLRGEWHATGPEGEYVARFEDGTVALSLEGVTFERVPIDVAEVGDDWVRVVLHHSDHDAMTVISLTNEEMTFGWLDDWVFTRL